LSINPSHLPPTFRETPTFFALTLAFHLSNLKFIVEKSKFLSSNKNTNGDSDRRADSIWSSRVWRRRFFFASLAVILIAALFAVPIAWKKPVSTTGIPFAISAEERELLELVEKSAFDFFWNECNTDNGLIKDRASYRYKTPLDYSPSTIAGAGYALSGYCIGVEKGWITREQAYNRALRTLQFFSRMQEVHGFFYHFVDIKSGVRTWKSELSPIDSTLFIAGALHAGQYFKGTEVEKLSRELYERMDWPWMMNGGRTLALGWSPEKGFQEWRWDHYSEAVLMYLLAIGSPTHPLPPSVWHELSRPMSRYGEHTCIASAPLFTHQYPQVWFDLRNKHDDYADYFQNSIQATLANRQFCIDEMTNFSTYGPNVWGLTACQAPDGYHAYGAKPGRALHDGTIAPTAAIGSIVFTPRESIDFIKYVYQKYPQFWGHYGFTDAFNLDKNWQSQEVLAIDQGTIMLMIENFLTGQVWREFMQNDAVQRGMKLAGFIEGKMSGNNQEIICEYFESKLDQQPTAVIPLLTAPPVIDGNPGDWHVDTQIMLDPKTNLEDGSIQRVGDIHADVRIAYDERALYILAVVKDDELVTLQTDPTKIFLDDLVEIYIDPENNNLAWGSSNDFQIGLTPSSPEGGGARSWAWFQKFDGGENIRVASSVRANDYVIEAAIDWKFLGVTPLPGKIMQLNVAVNDKDISNKAKLTWFFHDPGITLGRVILGGKL